MIGRSLFLYLASDEEIRVRMQFVCQLLVLRRDRLLHERSALIPHLLHMKNLYNDLHSEMYINRMVNLLLPQLAKCVK